jgi:hypothetical protein
MLVRHGATLGIVAALFAPSCGGKILAEPGIVTLAAAQNAPFDVVVDSTSVYWTNQGSVSVGIPGSLATTGSYANGAIMRMPTAGGVPTTLAFTGQNSPDYIALDPANVYWTSSVENDLSSSIGSLGGSVTKVALDGGSPVALATGFISGGLAVKLSEVFWTHFGGPVEADSPSAGCVCLPSPCSVTDVCLNIDSGAVMRLSPGGKPIELAALGQAVPAGIALDATNIYWINQSAGSVMKMPRSGGNPTVLATGQPLPQDIATDSTSVYWTAFGDGVRNGGAIVKVAIGGGVPTTLASGQNPAGIAVDDQNVYWTNSSSFTGNSDGGLGGVTNVDGSVMKVPLGGGAPVEVAGGQANPMGIAVDAASVYWANNGTDNYKLDGAIMKRTPK